MDKWQLQENGREEDCKSTGAGRGVKHRVCSAIRCLVLEKIWPETYQRLPLSKVSAFDNPYQHKIVSVVSFKTFSIRYP